MTGAAGFVGRTAGVALAALTVIGAAWASRAPLSPSAPGDAVLRLAWSALPERIETCREQSADTLAPLPAHMRQTLVCEGASASYRLRVRRNGELIADRVFRGGGLRNDRRLYVLVERPVPPGAADLQVRFDRIEPAPAPGNAAEAERARRTAAAALPPALALDERIDFAARRVLLVTYDPERRSLATRRASH